MQLVLSGTYSCSPSIWLRSHETAALLSFSGSASLLNYSMPPLLTRMNIGDLFSFELASGFWISGPHSSSICARSSVCPPPRDLFICVPTRLHGRDLFLTFAVLAFFCRALRTLNCPQLSEDFVFYTHCFLCSFAYVIHLFRTFCSTSPQTIAVSIYLWFSQPARV